MEQTRKEGDVSEVDTAAIDRLTAKRHVLAAHLAAQETELKETGQRLAALDVTIYRLRQKAAKNERN
jgi:hypothetical protein